MDTVTRSAILSKLEIQQAVSRLREELGKALPEGSFAEREAAMLVVLGEAGRTFLEEELQAIANGVAGRVLINGEEYKLHEPGTGTYYSLVGAVQVRRATYRQVGVRNGPTVVPVELLAGIIEGATPALSYDVAQGYAEHDMRTHGRQLESAYRVPPPRATLERLAKRLAASTQQAVPKLEPVLRQLGDRSATPGCPAGEDVVISRLAEVCLEGGRGERFEREVENVAVGAEALEGPSEVRLRGDAQCAAGGDDAEQDAGTVSALGAAGEEHVESQLGHVLELALGGRVVDGDERVVDEAEQRVSMILVVGGCRRQRLGRQESWENGVDPDLEFAGDGADMSLSMLAQRISAQTELLGHLFLAIHGADERATFGSEDGLSCLRVAELAAPVGVAAGFDDAA